ncbi:Crp/Fnr family transcriptional regulator [Aggregatimonas sangjinii]|uniref:Crp/Fnr family transcriptional regulator n=1 Tax=Aggregatimonas sangjinii TaxID=2583587 RepID=A0A5B7SK53_9FLAO|nr:Crp/Fnr family transcriptional regulator [Aggregatimonas sangjinii]QCW98826.1 Crp/Fnr family transcriptional regulator [Aggregatimonas sangjinii]
MIVVDYIKQISPISDVAAAELESRITISFEKKGKVLLKEGEVCSQIYFMQFGFAHQFKWDGTSKISNYFWSNHDFVTHMISFLTQSACEENIELLNDSKLYSLTYQDLQFMYREYPEFNHFGRVMLEKYFVDLAKLGALSKVRPALKRYELLLAEWPELFQLATSGQIASYLNMTQETLSRIRAKKL